MTMGQNSTEFDGTRAGITPDDTLLPFVISTYMMGVFIQKKIDAVTAEVNRTLPPEVPKIPSVKIRAYTTKMGEFCYPLTITLPESAFEKKVRRQQPAQNGRENPSSRKADMKNRGNGDGSFTIDGFIGDSETSDTRYEKVYYPIWKVLNEYMYYKPKRTFSDPEVRRFNQMTTGNANQLIRYASQIRVMRTGRNNKGPKIGVLMLDAQAIMHDMLFRVNDPRDFTVDIDHVKSKKNGNYDFHVIRRVKRKKDQQTSNEFNDLMRRIRSNGGAPNNGR